jgi:hypothetical protein
MSATLQGETESRSPLQELFKALAAQRIFLQEPDEIRGYLGEHPDLGRFLPVVCARTRQEFGNEVELSLAVYGDPEIEDHYLTLYVRQPVYSPDILARIRSIRGSFEEEVDDSSGWLLVTTDFRTPRCAHAI